MSASGIEYVTFQAFHDSVKDNVAPEGLAEELIAPFRAWVTYALADIQQIVPWFRDFNVQFYDKGGVEEFCNTSIFQGPQGKIAQLFAFKPSLDCNRLYYGRRSQAALDCWMERQRCLCPATVPPAEEIYLSPYCNYVVAGDSACGEPYITGEEDDCRFKSLDDDDRIFSVSPDYKVHAAPRFPCGYLLCLQWQGIKKKWVNTDLVPVDLQLQEAVENFVEHKVFKKEQQGQLSSWYEDYTTNLRMLKRRYQDEQEDESKKDCSSAVERLMSTFRIAYETSIYGGNTQPGISGGGDVVQVFIDRAPLPPDSPQLAALSYTSGGGPLLQWDIASQTWL